MADNFEDTNPTVEFFYFVGYYMSLILNVFFFSFFFLQILPSVCGKGIHHDVCITKKNEGVKSFRRREIKKAFLHAYNSYERCCFGADEIRPVSNDSRNEFGGIGATIFDNLDTLLLMDLKDEFLRAREFVKNFNFNELNSMVSVFETIIRVVGGLLSAYDLSGDWLFIEKAKEICDSIIEHSFHGVTGFPRSELNPKLGVSRNKFGKWVFLSEIATLNMEFSYLSHHTGDKIYKEQAKHITDSVYRMKIPFLNGLYPNMINIDNGAGRPVVSLGAHGDSAYEYFLKGFLLTGEPKLKKMYDESLRGIIKHLLRRSRHEKFLYLVELSEGKVVPKMDHLVCFLPGTIALGAKYNSNNGTEISYEQLKLAKELLSTCIRFYEEQKSKLGPEIVHFYQDHKKLDYFIKPGFDSHYLLRPETVESIFYLYRISKDESYLEIGWKIFLNLLKNCQTEVAFSGIRNVMEEGGGEFNDVMESFFLAETLKYLYLLFSDDSVLPLDKVVFNTEAHPLTIFRDEKKEDDDDLEILVEEEEDEL